MSQEGEEQDSVLSGLPVELQNAVQVLTEQYSCTAVEDILNIPRAHIERITGINTEQSSLLLYILSESIFPIKPIPLSQMVKDENYHKKVPFGCPVLDGMMRGGLPSQGIIELTGEAGSGKTQLALQLLLSTVAPARHGGLEGAAFYVSTEGEFPTRRWSQMLQVYCAEHPEVSPKEMEKNLFIHKVADLSSFWLMLTSKIKLLLRQKPIKVFIIDSVTALFRVDYPLKQCQERARVLTAHAHELLKLSDEFKIPVITVNQVQAFFEEFSGGGPEKSIPALGLAWSTCVNTRIVVVRTKRNWNGENVFSPNKKPKTTQTEGTWIRTMSIAWSPYLPPSSCEFIVTNSGVVGIADSSQ